MNLALWDGCIDDLASAHRATNQPAVKQGQEKKREEGAADDTSDDDGGEGALDFSSGTLADGHGDESQTGDKSGH
jgi:hypothetical protein